MKIPYGISNFESISTENYYFVDRTNYIEKLEKLGEKCLVFLRPRRFGKSLFISMLEHYYDIKRKDDFDRLFGKYYIGKNRTENAGKYMIFNLDFSGIQTETKESTFEGFRLNVIRCILDLCMKYSLNTEEIKKEFINYKEPADILRSFFKYFQNHISEKIYILIDEYDHFANEVLSFQFSDFSEMVARNGFVRKFYEVIKEGTGSGIVDRIFITGVTPITLDSLTSGFNISVNLSSHVHYNEMMGFVEKEVEKILDEFYPAWKNTEIENMRKWYNGYLFHKHGKERVYNPDMVLWFVKELFYCDGKYPDSLVDTNIASDYGKLKRLFSIKNRSNNMKIIENLIFKNTVSSLITEQFSFEKNFSDSDFISLLYYLGLLTIKDSIGSLMNLSFPNYVIRSLYWDFFTDMLTEDSEIQNGDLQITEAMKELGFNNNIEPFIKLIETTLKSLSNRDFIKFDEKYVKILFVGFANLIKLYYIKSEMEVDQNYPDVCFLERPPIDVKYQYIFEIKYLKETENKKCTSKMKEAEKQLKNYLKAEEFQNIKNLKAYAVVVCGTEVKTKLI